MSASQASKRRKLNGTGDEGLPHQHDRSRAPDTTADGADTDAAPSARESWFDLKRNKGQITKNKNAKKQEPELDVYDDIEGANATAPRFLQRPVGGQGRKGLDRRDGVIGKAKRGGGVFRQFVVDPAVEKKETARKRRKVEVEVDEADDVDMEESDGDEAEESSGDDAERLGLLTPEVNGRLANPRRSGRSPANGIAAATDPAKPKKTLEDEMRELQAQARQEVVEEGSGDELAEQDNARTPVKKQTPQRRSATRPKKEPQVKSATLSNPLDRGKAKAKAKEPVDEYEVPESDSENCMDVDEPHEGLAVQAESSKATPKKDILTPKKAATRLAKTSTLKSTPAFQQDHLQLIQRIAMEKANKSRSIPLVNLDDEYAKVNTLISQTITAGESNSMLLIGARGSGKSALVNQILREQNDKHPNDFHAVRLNGFVHTDDKIALREIWRQLGREMDLDQDEAVSKNYADTMTRLLALLSHPTEMGMETDQVTKSVIFVLDEFDLFASHPRQTLLYNLFDIAQSRKAPIAVLGLTTRIDVAESLEKRVKSRFSHRYVHIGLSKSLQAFEQIAKAAMTISPEELSEEENVKLGMSNEVATNPKKGSNAAAAASSLGSWNALMTQVLSSDTCKALFRRVYYTTKSIPECLASLSLAIASMPIDGTTASLVQHFTTAFSYPTMQHPDSKLTILSSLSSLQLALLVCAARLTNIYSTEVISFALAYEEYKVLATKAKLQASASGSIGQSKVWGKEVAKSAWEELVECGLVMEDGRSGGAGKVDVGLEEIGMSGVELGSWAKWCKEI